MSSFPRNLQRKAHRNRSNYEPRAQVTIINPTHYRTLHPTKGWRRVSNLRVRIGALYNYLKTGGKA